MRTRPLCTYKGLILRFTKTEMHNYEYCISSMPSSIRLMPLNSTRFTLNGAFWLSFVNIYKIKFDSGNLI